MKKNNKGFTLIELLAIIVILAIIAVITVPIILNIIENSRMGAATDSAYGYKDAVNKWYVTKLQEDSQFQLASSYTISSDGKLGDNVIPLSGDKPSGGELHYANNTLQGGCIVIGDYAVTFDGGNATSTEKGNCSGYVYNDASSVPTIASCTGCKFIYTTSTLTRGVDDMELIKGITEDYTKLNEHPYFLGLIADSNTGKIDRMFACGIKNGTPFCLEGYDTSKYSNNVEILNTMFEGCNASTSNYEAACNDVSSVSAGAYNYGNVYVGEGYNSVNSCSVYEDAVYCYEG